MQDDYHEMHKHCFVIFSLFCDEHLAESQNTQDSSECENATNTIRNVVDNMHDMNYLNVSAILIIHRYNCL